MSDFLIYGATGYTGQLIAREAVRRGLRPVLAGRNAQRVGELAAELNCPSRVFSLDSSAATAPHLAGIRAVLNCAGPFSATAALLIEAALAAKVHYLDITGEIDVIEAAAQQHSQATAAGIAIIPAVGFDVVPSDCLAAMLAAAIPSATHLQLALTAGQISRGTTKTVLESLPQGGRMRIDGQIRRVPVAAKTLEVPFPGGNRQAMSIPWGDVASAFYSTGIPNIEVFAALPLAQIRWLRRLKWLLPLLKLGPVRRLLQSSIDARVTGPTKTQREWEQSQFWGRASDAAGRTVEATLVAPSAYKLTALAALAAVERVLTGTVKPGFSTPSQAFGKEFILSIPGMEVELTGPR